MRIFTLFKCRALSFYPAGSFYVIKFVAVLLFTVALQLSLAGQKLKINISEKNAPLERIFNAIRSQTNYNFVYTREMLEGARQVSINVTNASLSQVLDLCFNGQPLSYRIDQNTIIISRNRQSDKDRTPVPGQTQLQKKRVTGIVRDTVGPMPGVSVKVKGTPNIGTLTDENGRYVLDVPDENVVLVVTMVGYVTQELPVKGKTVINVLIRPAENQLEEAVIVAFATQKKESIVASITTINPSELKVPSSNLTTALAGRLAGVIAYQRSGEPGLDNADFFIRGVTTFGYKKDPLILIDGVELTSTDLARMQPDDIESFSILKDATASALYGARGANGVILVKTKEGKEGKAKISARLENTISQPTQNIELADPVTYMRLNNEAVLTRDPLQPLPYSDDKIENTVPGSGSLIYPATDWKKALFKDYTMNQRFNLNVNGGGGVARYYVAGYFGQDNGILKVDKRNNFNNNISLKTYSLRSNVNVNLSKSTEMIIRLSGAFDDYTGPVYGGADMYKRVMRANPVLFSPYYPIDEDHKFVKHIMFGNYDAGNYLNPYADMVKGYKDYSRSNMIAQFEVKQDLSGLVNGLNFRTMVNTTRSTYFDVSRSYNPFWYQLQSYDARTGEYRVGILNETTGTEYLGYSEGAKDIASSLYLESALNYGHTFAQKHYISGLLVFIMRQSLNGNAGDVQSSLPFRNTGLSGRATYSYSNRYFTEVNFGYNGSERFYKTNRFGFFPSAGAAWSISNERFWEPLKNTVNNFRLRATYGLVGNDAIGNVNDRFMYLSNVNMDNPGRAATFGRDNTYTRNGISISRYSDPDITWETSQKLNLALELGLFNKVNFIGEYFSEKRKNILMTRAGTPATMGLEAQPRANVGKAEGEGVDLSLDYSQSFSRNLWIQGRANFTYATSKFVVYEEPLYTKEWWKAHAGYPISQEWGLIAERLFVDDYEAANSPKQNYGVYGGGDIKFRDVNGDGQITNLDQVPIGYPTTPEIVYGFGFSVGYKKFDFSSFFQGVGRESFWIDAEATAPFVPFYYQSERDGNAAILGYQVRNQLIKAYADDHWSEENKNLYALWPRLSPDINSNNTQRSTWFMRNGAFLRLKQVELGYTLTEKFTRRIGLSKLRIYANGTNLFSWTNFKLWDIEMAGNGLGYPVQKVFNIGVNVSL